MSPLAKTRRRARGQAVVELAVSMLVIVPTFMYVLFLDDLLRAKLDLEEAVITAPWEYARVNFEEGAAGSSLRSAIRLGWCDHTTAYNSYTRSYDCDETHHHVAMAAHQCWLTEGAKQVSCSVDKDFGKQQGLLTLDQVHSEYTQGGLVRCSARLGVINYYLPQRLFEEFSNVEMTRTEKKEGNVHDSGRNLAIRSHYLLEEQQAGLVVDTWALGKMERIDSGGSGNLKDRVNKVYQTYGGIGAAMGMQFYMNILRNDVVNMSLLADGMGDNPIDANIAFDPDNAGNFNEDMHGSPYDYTRGDHYMGAQQRPE
jgi:hypothetical protein